MDDIAAEMGSEQPPPLDLLEGQQQREKGGPFDHQTHEEFDR